ncbi:hypothetical protein BATDEDRAFT_90046 [Batrachochytrium dendrobatidis JAM81]|uniref:MPN domain-containing protein n=2 Tax=Batrachochytrium dendrobatidis TaxID=109871 RepID=F4P6T5_BATDJ|nr:uncharacterized protein BATDEDRAFT_90046 [Batrachochytrium dendrobatidis JAM81]EGF79064.1 hypothetical protein BATDEDRAFT_90046 [Batrachochytrium dendrobatidis JAM81]KAJ8325257.1 hypothetical protein O5D80_006201 [Batrachochytrium dendrobatidis]KAK5667413.1 hypothetical protein QVD99_006013 [Batrachochytrium dendrobatidis]OAJ42265.1 hypothetical protein BDEG_25736 [Batrachochytrium dendrobatidis JEL423]|eukprot:XP_006680561.1 hypothetical protein BATDEDRAFT_90046 [Batrachochytrium dendrobatidis JAM81]
MVSVSSYHISNKAYAKILLHSAKYSMDPVYGVLLGSLNTDGSSDGSVVVSDVVPMFHSHWILSPSMQFGMEQIEIYAKQTGLAIVGSYSGNELASTLSVQPAVAKAASDIDAHFQGGALLLMLDVACIKKQTFAVIPLTLQNTTWKPLNNTPATHDDDCHSYAMGLIKRSLYNQIYDLDNHLEDISLNWLTNNALKI